VNRHDLRFSSSVAKIGIICAPAGANDHCST